jgi:hypothetical protein
MIATVTHVTKDDPGARWGATAIYPRGLKPERLELYSIGYAGDGLEMTGLQVVDEFGTMSGPVILVPETEVGLAYDGALTLAFERDDGLAIGSGWPPVVIGFDPGTSPNRPKYVAGDLAQLFREPPPSNAWRTDAGAGYGVSGIGYAASTQIAELGNNTAALEAFVLVNGDPNDGGAQRVAVLITSAPVGPRDLRRVAEGAYGMLGADRDRRRLAVAISVAEPTEYDPKRDTRRALDGPAMEGIAAAAAHVTRTALDSLKGGGGRV